MNKNKKTALGSKTELMSTFWNVSVVPIQSYEIWLNWLNISKLLQIFGLDCFYNFSNAIKSLSLFSQQADEHREQPLADQGGGGWDVWADAGGLRVYWLAAAGGRNGDQGGGGAAGTEASWTWHHSARWVKMDQLFIMHAARRLRFIFNIVISYSIQLH